ncbi:hypothetical protein K3495_g5403 [Podosphaera aphanis]|nr:hypothetical protein K3495_g5403 [Podosphaera aphanis]
MGDLDTVFQKDGETVRESIHDYEVVTPSNSTVINESNGMKTLHEQSKSNLTQRNHSINQSIPYPIQAQRRQDYLNMSVIGNALPDVMHQGYEGIPNQRYLQGLHVPPQYMYHIPNIQQQQQQQQQQVLSHPTYSQQSFSNLLYSSVFQDQYGGIIMPGQPHLSNPHSGVEMGNPLFHSQSYIGQTYQPPLFLQSSQYPVQNQVFMGNQTVGPHPMGGIGGNEQRSNEFQTGLYGGFQNRYNVTALKLIRPSVVRGPPRKPRQSGHAIWIGNLPPQTDLMSLVIHVCKETKGLKSLFLISKSNCAFANFKDEEACFTAQLRVHDSRFQTVRLVSRLRRSSTVNTNHGSKPPSESLRSPTQEHQNENCTTSPESKDKLSGVTSKTESEVSRQTLETSSPRDKFFVVKSLTVEDLELSVRNGIWATQSHNESILNKAFETSDNVFLIFSANKSGEYFGYARMISSINDGPSSKIDLLPKIQTSEDPEVPRIIPTPASEFTPKGRIIDDSARGTIFWEVERDDEEDEENTDQNESSQSISDELSTSPRAWGNPFEVEWISTVRLPFYRTRGLRNPWNSNREVKIARDGTELETAVGRKLIGLFHRICSPVASSSIGSNLSGMSLPLVGGYQPINQYH